MTSKFKDTASAPATAHAQQGLRSHRLPHTQSPIHSSRSAQDSPIWPSLGILAIVCFVLYFYQLGSYPLFDVDEPRYAETAREMLERNDWITPYFNYELRLNKPVFFYWLIAIAYKMFGVSEFAARLFSAIAASGMVFATFGIGRWAVNNRVGLFSGLILATAIEMIGLARMSITDMTLAWFMTGTIASLFMVARHTPKWWLVAGLFSGLAILTKGPVGILLPGAILVLYTLFSKEFKSSFLTIWFPLGILTAIGVSIPWYIAAWQVHGQFFLDELYQNNFSRFSGGINYHIKPWHFYIPVVAVGFMPWSLFLPVTALSTIRTLASGAQRSPYFPLVLFATVWAGFIFTFFSISQTKLLTYILPMFPALALLTGVAFHRIDKQLHSQNPKTASSASPMLTYSWVITAVVTTVFAIAAPTFLSQPAQFLPKIASQIETLTANPLALVSVTTLILSIGSMTWFLSQRKIAQSILAIALGFCILTMAALHSIVPSINQVTQGAMLQFVNIAKKENIPLAMYEITRPSLTFYAQQHIPHIARKDYRTSEYDKISELLHQSSQSALYIITKNSLVTDLATQIPPNTQMRIVSQHPVYSLLHVSVVQPTPLPKSISSQH